MKHKLITAAILMVGVFFILRTSEAIVIKDHLITKDPKASTSCETPVANYTFTLDDDTAYSWVLTDGKTSGGDFRWFWCGKQFNVPGHHSISTMALQKFCRVIGTLSSTIMEYINLLIILP